MANRVKYTDAMVDEALAMRKRGEKQAVIHATLGAGIEAAIRRVQKRRRVPPLSKMDRASRALWQKAAAGRREWYAKPGFMFKRSSGVVSDVKFTHRCLLDLARRGVKFDPYWWA